MRGFLRKAVSRCANWRQLPTYQPGGFLVLPAGIILALLPRYCCWGRVSPQSWMTLRLSAGCIRSNKELLAKSLKMLRFERFKGIRCRKAVLLF